MARPYVRTLHVEDVSPLPWSVEGFGDAKTRLLSRDPATGASTELLELPPGWHAPVGSFGAALELLIFHGGIRVGEFGLGRFSYTYLPAGVSTGPWSSGAGARVLWMQAAELDFVGDVTCRPGARTQLSIPHIDPSALPWQPTVTPGFPSGAMRKTLRVDPDSGAGTWLLGMLPQVGDKRREIHPTAEEAFTLIGESTSDRGLTRPGEYFWRPAFIPHGPFYTEVGVMTLFRTDGPLRTDYIWPEP
jgi:hypothetical protein